MGIVYTFKWVDRLLYLLFNLIFVRNDYKKIIIKIKNVNSKNFCLLTNTLQSLLHSLLQLDEFGPRPINGIIATDPLEEKSMEELNVFRDRSMISQNKDMV